MSEPKSTSDAKPTRDQAGIERLVIDFAACINARSLYTAEHPRVTGAITRVIDGLETFLSDRAQDSVTFLIVGGELLVDQKPLRTSGLYQRNFIESMRRRGVERLTLARGLDLAECHWFIETMAAGGVPSSTQHLIVGQVEATVLDGVAIPAAVQDSLSIAQLESVRESFMKFRSDRGGSLRLMEEVVWSVIDALSRATQEVLPLVPLKEHDAYTFVHSINVTFLVLAQARSFGIKGDLLHAVGLAALLHDIGKMEIPVSILNKPGKLEGEEWVQMTSHAELGAWTLAGLEQSAPLTILVAYEHHLRFDGVANYPILRRARRPTLASQMTSLADTYDAICTQRPYQRAQSQQAALEILDKRAGTFLDPFLVGNFRRVLGQTPK